MHQILLAGIWSQAAFLFLSLFFLSPVFAGENLESAAVEYRVKGYAAQQKGNFDEALMFYDKAIALGDNSAEVYNDIGIVYEQLGAYERAQESYGKAILQNPDYLPPYGNLAYMYKEQGNNPKALQYFKERFARAPADDLSREKYRLEIVALYPDYKDHIVEAEMQNAKQALQQKQQDNFGQDISRSEQHYQRGKEFAAKKDFEKAVVELDRALALTPENPKILREKQRALYGQQVEKIRKSSDSAVKMLENGDVESARKEFQDVLSAIPIESVPGPE